MLALRDAASQLLVAPVLTTACPLAASTMLCQPVHLHRWASNAEWVLRQSTSLGGPRKARRMMIPGVQKPHWLAPVARKASTHLCRTSESSPSSVTIWRPATRLAGVTQATLALPSTQTVQQPHWP